MVMLRFRVAEDSMRPALVPGAEFVATESRSARVGDLVALPHPERDDFWLVKRRVDPPQPLPDDLAWVASDNPTVNGVDSRSFGPVPVEALRPVVERLDSATFGEAVDLLTTEDTALAAIVARHGPPQFWHRHPGFSTLVLFILEQQVSLESGAAVFRRISNAAGSVKPESVLALGEEGLRAAGTTRQKAGYLIGLAESVLSADLDFDELERMSSVHARDVLLRINGVGPWTADVYLLSALRHVDVLPVGDRALQVGAAEALSLSTVPTPGDLELIAEPWRPLRSVAARLIWHGYLARRGRSEPEHPATSLGREA
jgi:DNA-3-methyladenine glycosylase II